MVVMKFDDKKNWFKFFIQNDENEIRIPILLTGETGITSTNRLLEKCKENEIELTTLICEKQVKKLDKFIDKLVKIVKIKDT